MYMLCAVGPEEVHVRALPAGGGAGSLRQLPGPLLPPGLGTAVEHVRQLWLTRNNMDGVRGGECRQYHFVFTEIVRGSNDLPI